MTTFLTVAWLQQLLIRVVQGRMHLLSESTGKGERGKQCQAVVLVTLGKIHVARKLSRNILTMHF